MKRLLSLCLLLLILLSSLTCAQAGSGWYCPYCGRYNDNNYCPKDGTKRPDLSEPTHTPSSQSGSSVYATLNRKLATRTGPSTKYDEPGTFLSAGSRVKILSKAYDTSNGIWWVHVEFTSSGKKYRAYTGAKRFDDLNLNAVPEEEIIGSCRVSQSLQGYYGPSVDYAKISRKIPSGVQCDIYSYVTASSRTESDFIQIEFYDSSLGCKRRAWVEDWRVENCRLYNCN